uniref:Adaptin ear-binding coat-associated protein 1 n=1 Tax=Anas platyrhynchos TaxID=8839 RepID=A0A8B9ZIE7_ANAPL
MAAPSPARRSGLPGAKMAPAALALSGPVPRWPRGAARCLPRRPPAPNVGGAVPALSKDGGRKCPLLLGSQPSLRAGLGSEMAAAELEYESVLCVKPDVSVYRIPPRTSNRGYRASDWKLDHPDWTGRLRVTSKGKTAYIKLEDKVSGELFAQAPIDQYPGIAVETVTDSSRYFVIRIQDGTDILLDLDAPVSASKAPATATADLWGDFSTASSAVPNQAPQQSNWVQF